jgi:DNA invertase Pin-like site-specific DNA recombinase
MNKISSDHLGRRAYIYIRQSTLDQVHHNLESQRGQYALADRARELGWHDVEVIDDDLGRSGADVKRPGFERLLGGLCDGRVGAVFCVEASRLARNGRNWHTLLEFCSVVGALLIDADGIYDPRDPNDRLLLGMNGQISEIELANFRTRAQAALAQKARRGDLIQRVAVGSARTDTRLEKSSDARVRDAIELVFCKFKEFGSVRQLYFWLRGQDIQLRCRWLWPSRARAGSALSLASESPPKSGICRRVSIRTHQNKCAPFSRPQTRLAREASCAIGLARADHRSSRRLHLVGRLSTQSDVDR